MITIHQSLPGCIATARQPEKMTRQIVIGRTREGKAIKIWIGATLHKHLTSLMAITHSTYKSALIASAEEGAVSLINRLAKVAVNPSDSMRLAISPEARRIVEVYSQFHGISEQEAASEALEFFAHFISRMGVDFDWRDEAPEQEQRGERKSA